MTRKVAAALTLVVFTGACAAPRAGLEVGSKDVPVNIVLGRQGDAVAPPPSFTPNPGFPGFIQPPIPRPEPGAPPPAGPILGPCPLANPLDPSELVANRDAPYAPARGTYTYRNAGTLSVGDVTTEYPDSMTRRVRAVRATGSGTDFEFDVDVTVAGVTTTTTYRALNSGLTPDRGLYIVQVVTPRPEGTESFTPDPPILLMPFVSPEYGTNLEDELDRTRGEGYRSQGTDPLSQTTMTLEAKIDGKSRVNACGEWVDAFDVVVTQGQIVGPTKQLTFSGHYIVAPQYGGLVVEDHITMSGTETRPDGMLEPVSSDVRSIIDVVPNKPPRAPEV
jgi:hypothetical protein